MRNFIAIIIGVMLMHSFLPDTAAQQLSQDPLYKLVFQDEFDSLGLNYNNWRTQPYWGSNLWNSNKVKTCEANPDIFPDDSVDIAYNSTSPNDTSRAFDTTGTGFQRLKFYKKDFDAPILKYSYPCPSSNCTSHGAGCYTDGNGDSFCAYDTSVRFKFSGAMMLSKHKYKYGYFEIKYRLKYIAASQYNAYGPNFWMWATNDADSAAYSEIDIFEQRGTDWKMGMNMHYRKTGDTIFWRGSGSPTSSTTPYPEAYYGPYVGGSWYTIGCEWTPEYIDAFYNSNDTTRRFSKALLPVDKLTAMALIIDSYTPAFQYCIPFNDQNTTMPFEYDIDYVKVYQVKQNCVSKSYLNTSSSTYQDTLYLDLTIGGSGGSAVFNGSTHHLAAQEFVLLQEGFEVSGTGTVTVSTKKCQSGQTMTYNANDPVGELTAPLLDDFKAVKQPSSQ